ncbi:unnamed protein product, partial [marine sediment metagenome]
MIRSKTLISQLLTGLKDNIQRTGDPLGIKAEYWTEWARGLNLPRSGETIIITGRMYQMLPYIASTTSLLASTKGFLSRRILGDIARRGSSIAGEKAIMWRAKKEEEARSTRTLCGIAKALSAIGYKPAYLYEDEPYSGALLYDLSFLIPFLVAP